MGTEVTAQHEMGQGQKMIAGQAKSNHSALSTTTSQSLTSTLAAAPALNMG
jgi:hypothetical protein